MALTRSISARAPPGISRRGDALLGSENRVESAIARAFTDVYSPKNPKGLVSLGLAENWLMQDWLVEHFNNHFKLVPSDMCYQSVANPNLFKAALAGLFNQYFQPVIPVKQEHFVTGVGATVVLEQLLYTICDEDDRVLIAKPYYPGFDRITKQRLRIHISGIDIPRDLDPSSEGVLSCFESAYQNLKDSGSKNAVKCVMICNPNNPLGFTYSRDVLILYLKFCEKYDLHLIVDEIYAFSIFNCHSSPTTPTESHGLQTIGPMVNQFVSALSIDCHSEADCDPRRLHVVYGTSKDFGTCGLRTGVLVSQHNPVVIKSVRSIATQMQIPRSTEVLLEKFLGDAAILHWYIQTYQTKRKMEYDYAVQRLKDLKIDYLWSYAGHFIVIDLQKFLPSQDPDGKHLEAPFEKEEVLFLRLLNEFKLYLGPMMIAYHYPMPGFFRLTFTTSRTYLELGLSRLKKFLEQVSNTESSAC